MSQAHESIPAARKTFWAAAAFYLLIGLEFCYMATPFAIYFYSIYRPALDLVGSSPTLAWLSGFFLPHFVIDTTSDLLNARNEIGIVFAGLGLLLFFVGVAQVYYNKLTRRGAATGGLYNTVRHPQYASLMLSSFGLLILWPRYLVLLSFVAMMFVYYFLARLEEKECERKFGGSYVDYKRRTGMFIPLPFPEFAKLRIIPREGVKKIAVIAGLYIVVSAAAIGAAYFLKGWSIDRIYALYNENAAFVSITRVSGDSLDNIVSSVLENGQVREILRTRSGGASAKYVGYVLPPGYFAMEIPMVREDSVERFHFIRTGYDRTTCRVILTEAADALPDARGKEILLKGVRRVPILEAWVALNNLQVMRVESLAGQAGIVRMPGPMF